MLIDEAHALGQISLDMKAYDADFCVGNGYNGYSPKARRLVREKGVQP